MRINGAKWGVMCLVLCVWLSFFSYCGSDDDDDNDDDDMADDDMTDDDVSDDDQSDDDVIDDDAVDDDAADDDVVAECWQDLAVGEKQVFADGFAGTEGIAFSAAGEMYVSAGGDIARVSSDGTSEPVAELTNAVGIAFTPDGALYVCEFGTSSLPQPNDGAIYRVDPDDSLHLVVEGIPNPNFIIYSPQDTLLVSDNMANIIYEVSAGGVLTEWLNPIQSPNGMVYAPDRQALYVAGTFAVNSPVYRIDLDAAGEPTGVEEIAQLDALGLPDGIAMDENGILYVTENSLGKIVRVNPNGGETEVVAEGMLTPASMAFGRGEGFDPCSIYVTELVGSKIWRVSLGVRGFPLVSEE